MQKTLNNSLIFIIICAVLCLPIPADIVFAKDIELSINTLSPRLSIEQEDINAAFSTAKKNPKHIVLNQKGSAKGFALGMLVFSTFIGYLGFNIHEALMNPAARTQRATSQMQNNLLQIENVISQERQEIKALSNPTSKQKEIANAYIEAINTINSFDWEKQRETIRSQVSSKISAYDEKAGLIGWMALNGIDFPNLVKPKTAISVPLRNFAQDTGPQELPKDFSGLIFLKDGSVIIAGKNVTNKGVGYAPKKFVLKYEEVEEQDNTGAGALIGLAVGGWGWGFRGAVVGTAVGYVGGALTSEDGKELYKAETEFSHEFVWRGFRSDVSGIISFSDLQNIKNSTYVPSPAEIRDRRRYLVEEIQDQLKDTSYPSTAETMKLKQQLERVLQTEISIRYKDSTPYPVITILPASKASVSSILEKRNNLAMISKTIEQSI